MSSVFRKHVGRLPKEGGDLGESGARVSGGPWCPGQLWHVCVSRHRYIVHAPGGDLLPVCHRYYNDIQNTFTKVCHDTHLSLHSMKL